MNFFKPRYAEAGHRNYASRNQNKLSRPVSAYLNQGSRLLLVILVLIVGSNFLSHMIWNPYLKSDARPETEKISAPSRGEELYLMDKASLYVSDMDMFEHKVREISAQLDIPPSWLMSVMYSESRFDASVLNHKGSGATGLIQFMPATASDLNVSVQRLKRMTHTQQLEYVYLYLQQVRERYGEYESLTDLYLAILYPKARKQDICYTLYAKPSQSYKQNSGLDKDKDGRVTVSDIDRHMEGLYPFAYSQRKNHS
jgi:hypothetical protein